MLGVFWEQVIKLNSEFNCNGGSRQLFQNNMTETSDLNIKQRKFVTKKGRSAYHYTAHNMQKVKYLHCTTSKRMESIRENILNITGNYGNEHFTADCRSQQEKGTKSFANAN